MAILILRSPLKCVALYDKTRRMFCTDLRNVKCVCVCVSVCVCARASKVMVAKCVHEYFIQTLIMFIAMARGPLTTTRC